MPLTPRFSPAQGAAEALDAFALRLGSGHPSPEGGFFFGPQPSSLDAALYACLAFLRAAPVVHPRHDASRTAAASKPGGPAHRPPPGVETGTCCSMPPAPVFPPPVAGGPHSHTYASHLLAPCPADPCSLTKKLAAHRSLAAYVERLGSAAFAAPAPSAANASVDWSAWEGAAADDK